MVSDRSIKVAKYGPVAAILCVIVLGVGVAVAVQLFDIGSPDVIGTDAYYVAMGALFFVSGAVAFYQAQFILRHPQAAIEHDVHPPSKYDLGFETRRGAMKIGTLSLLGSAFALVVGLGGVMMGL